MRRALAALCIGLSLIAGGAAAQDITTTGEDAAAEATAQVQETAHETLSALDEFDALARRAEEAVDNARASTAAFDALRDELADWRDRLDAADTNASRRATLEAQIEALGPAPAEGETEPEALAQRRAALQAELDGLTVPLRLAQEARARADGLIAEIDALIRDRTARTLSERGPMPILPSNWPAAASGGTGGLALLRAEIAQSLTSETRMRQALEAAPSSAILMVAGLALLIFGRRLSRALEDRAARRARSGVGALTFLLSLGEILLPYLGLVGLYGALMITGLVEYRLEGLLTAVLTGGLFVITARWLAGQLFPASPRVPPPPVELGRRSAAKLGRNTIWIGWVMAAQTFASAFSTSLDVEQPVAAVLSFPLHVLLGLILFGFGRRLAREMVRQVQNTEDGRSFRDRVIVSAGRITMLAGIAGPLVAAVGFDAGATFLQLSTAQTLALLGALILLQRFVFDFWALLTRRDTEESDSLAPVLIAFALTFSALPVLALIWGARVVDLTELWTRFRQGFSLGDTTISPSQFLVFAITFAAIYILTRLVQGGLRTAVLPKTRLDVGGQNAIAAGVGYIGIFAAAIIGIASAGVNLSALGFVAGALSVGIGFGLQNIVSNFVSGIILLIERPISQGDWIEVGGQMGYVRDISVRATRIETFDRTDVIVPNADFVSGTVINWTRGNLVGRVIVPVGVAYGSDTQRVSDILLDIARQHPMVLMNPEPYVYFKGFGESSLDFEIRAILRDINWLIAVRTEMNHAIAGRFAEEGIEIPFAQRDIWLRNAEVLQGEYHGPPDPASAPDADGAAEDGDDWRDALKGERPHVVKGDEP